MSSLRASTSVSAILARFGITASTSNPVVAPDAPALSPDDPDQPKPPVVAKPGASLDPVAVTAAITEAHALGTAEANTRWQAVLKSPAGKANTAAAVFMLSNSAATAETIIAELPELGAESKPADPQAGAPKVDLGDNPTVDLGASKGTANQGDDQKVDATALWDKTLGVGAVTHGGGATAAAMSQMQAAAYRPVHGGH